MFNYNHGNCVVYKCPNACLKFWFRENYPEKCYLRSINRDVVWKSNFFKYYDKFKKNKAGERNLLTN